MLHLIFQSPIEAAILERIDPDDVVVFLENAVLRVLQNSNINAVLKRQLSNNRLCVLADDIVIRGIAKDELIEEIEVIDYAGLVELTVNNAVIQSWT
ncbi:sulfurtransferase complex subunit TusB [Candidatus Methylobacter oryzae]|uniref:Sulfurtransferase complex subunit TusB n=1 Tax=Candidatus Methylobacter oryzae TaxID=2497749 RepID=A0ABY3CDL5_9GAMM|nr:sulfurtransferase complex subunit TusB [Candidatus Methylobacter oryzae]TRX00524.1 sulfurtransferase complex subunit TusB [Candidatus Methylobacter oryzae]